MGNIKKFMGNVVLVENATMDDVTVIARVYAHQWLGDYKNFTSPYENENEGILRPFGMCTIVYLEKDGVDFKAKPFREKIDIHNSTISDISTKIIQFFEKQNLENIILLIEDKDKEFIESNIKFIESNK